MHGARSSTEDLDAPSMQIDANIKHSGLISKTCPEHSRVDFNNPRRMARMDTFDFIVIGEYLVQKDACERNVLYSLATKFILITTSHVLPYLYTTEY